MKEKAPEKLSLASELITKIDIIDKKLSSNLHESRSTLAELFLLPFGFAFSTYGLPFVVLLIVLKLIYVESELSGKAPPARND